MNQIGNNIKLTLKCSNIDYFNDYFILKEDYLETSFNYSQQIHDK